MEAEIATEHRQRIQNCVSIVRSHYKHGASSVSIADVSNFKTPEELEGLLSKMSNEHVAYIHGMLTGKRIPRPASMGGPTSDSLKK